MEPDAAAMLLRYSDEATPHHLGGASEYFESSCPNCERPLMVYLSLDMRDCALAARLGWTHADRRFEVLHCPRCEIQWGDFRYKLRPDRGVIEIMESDPGGGEPVEGGVQGSGFPKCGLALKPLPDRIQEIYRINRQERKLTDLEIAEVAAVTGDYALEKVGGYPLLRAQCQLFGFPYLQQDADVRETSDGRAMQFLASFSANFGAPFQILPSGAQMLVWHDAPSGEVLLETFI